MIENSSFNTPDTFAIKLNITKKAAPFFPLQWPNPTTQPRPISHLLYRSSALHQSPNPPDKQIRPILINHHKKQFIHNGH